MITIIVLIVNIEANNYKKTISNSWYICQKLVYAIVYNIIINQINVK